MPDGLEFLTTLKVGEPLTHEGLSTIPLFGDVPDPDYLMLDEGLAGEQVTITETSEHGAVPELMLENRAGRPVLLLDGEELVGAKQNRILNTSVLAPAHSVLSIPVSCVEQGRWAWASRRFGTSDRLQFASGRAAKMEQVRRRMRAAGQRTANQGAVWDQIAAKSERLGVRSPTMAMSEIFEAHERRLRSFNEAMRPQPGQVGALFARGDVILGLEVLGGPRTYARLAPKLIRSHALDAIEWDDTKGSVTAAKAEAFIRRIAAAETERMPAVGLGDEIRFQLGSASGLALQHDGRMVHLVAFSAAALAHAHAAW